MAHKTDMYSFGLLIWRIVLECQTPFDNDTMSQRYPAFADVSRVSGHTEKLFLIQDLKEKEDDELLLRIKTTIPGHGLNNSQVTDFLTKTVRFRPEDRINSLLEIIDQSEYTSPKQPEHVPNHAPSQASVPDSKFPTMVSIDHLKYLV